MTGATEGSANLQKALTMAANGMDFYKAWLECSKLPGGATSWGNAQRAYKRGKSRTETAASAAQQEPPKKTPAAKGKGKAHAPAAGASTGASTSTAATMIPSERTGKIIEPRVQRTSHQVAKALDLKQSYHMEYKEAHKLATRAYADAAAAGSLRKPGFKPADIAAMHPFERCTVHKLLRAHVYGSVCRPSIYLQGLVHSALPPPKMLLLLVLPPPSATATCGVRRRQVRRRQVRRPPCTCQVRRRHAEPATKSSRRSRGAAIEERSLTLPDVRSRSVRLRAHASRLGER